MQLMVFVVYAFALLSALFWLYALAVNVGLSIVRWTSDVYVKPSTVVFVGTLGGVMAVVSTAPLWKGWAWPWVFVLVAPDVIAFVSDRIYYRKHPPPLASDSDNPES